LHRPVPLAAEDGTGSDISAASTRIHGAQSGFLGRARAVEETPTFAIEVTQLIGLQPVGEGAKQEMARKVRGRWPATDSVPTAAKPVDVEIAQACEDASWDDAVRVVVVTGSGRAFCVGADLKSWQADYLGKPGEYWKWFGAFKDAHDRLREIGKPTVARINGICVGGGNELQMACDLAVMVDDAFIRHVGPEHGSVPAGGATQWLPLMVGDRRAREIILLCEEIPAAQALEWGLVSSAVWCVVSLTWAFVSLRRRDVTGG
jgi:hypothetical protein